MIASTMKRLLSASSIIVLFLDAGILGFSGTYAFPTNREDKIAVYAESVL